jgi:FMN phosphatase YigB (HAD superfamily)
MIKAIIFDLFGVLVTEGFKQFCDTYFPGDITKRRRAIALVTDHDSGYITQDQYMKGLADLAGINVAIVNQHMSGNQPNNLLINHIKRELKPSYKIGVLSNSGGNYVRNLLEPQDLEIFNDIVLSYRHGIVKPQAEIFELAARRLGVKTKECVFIDDSQNHCEGARHAGMQALFYQDFPQMKRNLEKLLAADTNN